MSSSPVDRHLDEAELTALGDAVLARARISSEAARSTVGTLVMTELFAISSHGFQQLPRYVHMLNTGAIDGYAQPCVLRDEGATVLVDAQHGMGQMATTFACEIAKARVPDAGICLVSVRNSNHFGAAFPYCAELAEAGFIAFLATNTPPNMAPWGGRDRVVGNNPFAWSIPRRDRHPLVLDIACSVAAGSRLAAAGTTAGTIPGDWALDRNGEATTDPAAVYSYLPIGGHKGYGLALILEVLAGVLSGSLFSTQLPARELLGQRSWDVGHLLIVVDPSRLTDIGTFDERIEQLVTAVATSKLRPGFSEVLVPGEREYRSLGERRRSGVPLPGPLIEELRRLASS